MLLGCMICTGMYGSGVVIGMEDIQRDPWLTQRGQVLVRTACCVAGLSIMVLGIPARPTVATARLLAGSIVMGSGLRGLVNYCLVIYNFNAYGFCFCICLSRRFYEVENI